MTVMYYDGYTHPTKDGSTVRHMVNDEDRITFDVTDSRGEEVTILLTADEAFKLGLSLFRDVSLLKLESK